MKGKWAKGIPPRFFAWIIKDKLAISERPGGYARNHRRVRRQEEILWLRGEGFTRVVSLLASPHNLHAYDELNMPWANIPFNPHDDPAVVLPELYGQLRDWMAAGERLLVHHEELNDRLMGMVGGYLRWSGMVPAGPQTITVVEQIMHRQMGPDGREMVAMAPQLAGASGSGTPIAPYTRTIVSTTTRTAPAVAPAATSSRPAVLAARTLGGSAPVTAPPPAAPHVAATAASGSTQVPDVGEEPFAGETQGLGEEAFAPGETQGLGEEAFAPGETQGLGEEAFPLGVAEGLGEEAFAPAQESGSGAEDVFVATPVPGGEHAVLAAHVSGPGEDPGIA